MHGVLCLLKGVSAFPHLQVQIKTHDTRGLSLESSPTGRVCPGLSSLMIEDIIKKASWLLHMT